MKKEFIVNRQGKDFVLYAGLLDQAHQEGLKRITTTLLQAPGDANGQLAIVYAEVETGKGIFAGIGDASPQNVGRMIAMHTVRMAETRAKARALRDAINVGVTALEELADDDEPAPAQQRTLPRPVAPDAAPAPRADVPPECQPAMPEQLDRLRKLQVALGRGQHVPAGLSFADAAAQITELVRAFNAQARGARK